MVTIAIDIETYGKRGEFLEPELNAQNFVLGCLMIQGRKTPYFFKKAEDMWNFIIELAHKNRKYKHNIYVYAHNHKYDYYGYAKGKILETDKIKIMTLRPFTAMIMTGERTTGGYLADTQAFYNCSLKEMGNKLGTKKLEMPINVKDIEELKAYVQRDVEIVLKGIQKIKETLKRVGVRTKKLLTAGQVSMTTFQTLIKKRYYCKKCEKILKGEETRKDKIIVTKRGIEKEKKIKRCKRCESETPPLSAYLFIGGTMHKTKYPRDVKRAYRGERVEAIKKGNVKGITYIDINGLYPWCLMNMEIPDPTTERKEKNPEFYYTKEEILKKIGIAKAIVEVPDNELGYLPIRDKRGRIYFPRRSQLITPTKTEYKKCIRGWWTIFELRRAEEEGYKIRRIEEMVWYKPLPFNPFKEYIETLYKERVKAQKEGNYVISGVIKLLMNSLYGKLGQNRPTQTYEKIHGSKQGEYLNKGFIGLKEIGEETIMYKEGKRRYSKFANPIFPAHVTAYARDKLYKEMKKIPIKDLCYCATDCIIFKGEHLNKFKIGNDLGDFKIVYKDEDGYIAREKWYMIQN